MKSFKNILTNKIGLDEEHYIPLENVLKRLKLKKKEFLIKEGETCSFIGFQETGVQRT